MLDLQAAAKKRALRSQQINRSSFKGKISRSTISKIAAIPLSALFLGAIFLIESRPVEQARAYEPPRSSSKTTIRKFAGDKSGSEMARFSPPPGLARIKLVKEIGKPTIDSIPPSSSIYQGRIAALDQLNEIIYFSLNPTLQNYISGLVKESDAQHTAVVVMESRTGRVLAMSDKSKSIDSLLTHSGFPAASLFKLVTTAAAFDRDLLSPADVIRFHGGNYTLNKWNYKPDSKRDTKAMSLAEALGKSCNPVFSRVALRYLSSTSLERYAEAFGFNGSIPFNLELAPSKAQIPDSDYLLGRTAAGFGQVFVSPIHAAAMMSGIASEGVLLEPSLIDSIKVPSGNTRYEYNTNALVRMMNRDASRRLLAAMESTTTVGTSRREFSKATRLRSRNIRVAAKTGTLTGSNPQGLNNWFIAAAPIDNPVVSVAVVTVHPHKPRYSASYLGRLALERYFAQGTR